MAWLRTTPLMPAAWRALATKSRSDVLTFAIPSFSLTSTTRPRLADGGLGRLGSVGVDHDVFLW